MWDHQPSARELLDARLKRGWQPISSDLRGGERVLGYAACLVDKLIKQIDASRNYRYPNLVFILELIAQ